MRIRTTGLLILVCIAVVGGCGRNLMPTPNLYLDASVDPFRDVPPSRQSNVVEILYATDRDPLQPRTANETLVRYGTDRSNSLAFGIASVQIGPDDLTWEELASASRAKRRSPQLALQYVGAEELIRLPAWPWTTGRKTNPSLTRTEVDTAEAEAKAAIQRIIAEQLAESESKDVFIFVHGFNNTFEYAATSVAEMWHMTGRPGAMILYSWPAASGGAFGYAHDRESSEFTVSHFKRFIELVAACDAVERIHLASHSRGADVMAAAVRELHIKYKARGMETKDALKLFSLFFFAADLDLEVVIQRIEGEGVLDATNRTTIYTGKDDTALAFAADMFKSQRRLGQVGPDAVEPYETQFLEEAQDYLNIIYRPAKRGFVGHAYFMDDPAVSSDIILSLLEDAPPGAEHGRPLVHDPSGVWLIPDGYPRVDAVQVVSDPTR